MRPFETAKHMRLIMCNEFDRKSDGKGIFELDSYSTALMLLN